MNDTKVVRWSFSMEIDPLGSYVTYHDYMMLKEDNDRLRAELERRKLLCDGLNADMLRHHEEAEKLRAGLVEAKAQRVPDGYRLQPLSEYEAMCAALQERTEIVRHKPTCAKAHWDRYQCDCGLDGMVRVPITLTEKMFEAADHVYSSPHAMWSAMLAAAKKQGGE